MSRQLVLGCINLHFSIARLSPAVLNGPAHRGGTCVLGRMLPLSKPVQTLQFSAGAKRPQRADIRTFAMPPCMPAAGLSNHCSRKQTNLSQRANQDINTIPNSTAWELGVGRCIQCQVSLESTGGKEENEVPSHLFPDLGRRSYHLNHAHVPLVFSRLRALGVARVSCRIAPRLPRGPRVLHPPGLSPERLVSIYIVRYRLRRLWHVGRRRAAAPSEED